MLSLSPCRWGDDATDVEPRRFQAGDDLINASRFESEMYIRTPALAPAVQPFQLALVLFDELPDALSDVCTGRRCQHEVIGALGDAGEIDEGIQDVRTGQDTNQPAVLEHGKGADLVPTQNTSRLVDRRVRPDGNGFGGHDVGDGLRGRGGR